MIEIPKFAELVEPILQAEDKSLKVSSYKTENLVASGENYGSVILAVEVILTNGETINLVAKLNPPSEIFKRIFNIPIAFRKEAEFYEIIVPILNKFQNKHNLEILDSFPKYYGSRYTLQSDKNVFDDDACLLMENVKFSGYTAMNRHIAYDLETAEYIMRTMADFHAIPIALKLLEPKTFEVVKAHLPLNLTDPEITFGHVKKIEAITKAGLLQDKETALVAEKVITMMNRNVHEYLQMEVLGSEPFNTITHNDLWKSNIMLKLKDGKPIANRLVDYQLAAYGNPANDILFYIYTSVKPEDIDNHYDSLIRVYYQAFIKKLKEFNVDTEQFSWEAFCNELTHAATKIQLYHILFMIVTVLIKVKDGEAAEDTFKSDLSSMLDESYSKQLKAIIMSYIKNGWV